MVYVVSERPAVGLSGPMADPEVLSSEDTAKSRLALYSTRSGRSRGEVALKIPSIHHPWAVRRAERPSPSSFLTLDGHECSPPRFCPLRSAPGPK